MSQTQLTPFQRTIRSNIRNLMLNYSRQELLNEIWIRSVRFAKAPWATCQFETSCIRELIAEWEAETRS